MSAMRVPSCCGKRMLWHAMKDEVNCPKCGRSRSGASVYAEARYLYLDTAHGPLKITTDATVPPMDQLDVMYDGVSLRILLIQDERGRQERGVHWRREAGTWTASQRAAVSAHWSAQLRAKVKSAAERELNRVVVDLEDP